MKLTSGNMKKLLFLITFGILLYLGLNHLQPVLAFIRYLFVLFSPFLIGLCIAFILNVPLRFFEKLLFRRPGEPRSLKERLRRPVSLAVTLLVVLGVIAVVMFLVIPELADTLISLANRIPSFFLQLQQWINDLVVRYPELTDWLGQLEIDWSAIAVKLTDFLRDSAGNMLNSTVNAASSVVSGVVNFCLGFVFAIYVLMQKEKLGAQIKKLMYAYLPERRTTRLLEIGSLSGKTFSSFLSGQCLEACILGFMFFVVMTLLRFPYALMISVLTTFTALIPVFGAIIGWLTGALVILTVDPVKALWFLILFQVLQQIEGNLIYPHVVGNSVGLPSIWVLVAVTLGGSTMGLVGMLVFSPLCSVLYTLLRSSVNRRLAAKRLAAAQSAPPPAACPSSGDCPPPLAEEEKESDSQ